jgi:hypothetical protein
MRMLQGSERGCLGNWLFNQEEAPSKVPFLIAAIWNRRCFFSDDDLAAKIRGIQGAAGGASY